MPMCWIIYCAIILRCVDSELLKLWAHASWFWIFIFYMLWILVPINIIVIQYTWISVDCTIQIKALVIGCTSNEWGIDFCSTASGSNSLLQRLKYYSHKFVELHFAYIAEAWIRYVFLAINCVKSVLILSGSSFKKYMYILLLHKVDKPTDVNGQVKM